MTALKYHVYVERGPFEYGIHIVDEDRRAIALPLESLTFTTDFDEGAHQQPVLRLDESLIRALYDGIGEALGGYHPEAKQAAESLAIERKRVDSLLGTVQAVALGRGSQ